MGMKHGKKTVRMKMAAKTSVQTAAKTAAQRAAAKTAARLAAKLCVLLLAAALAFPETAFAGQLDSTFTVERLDDGLLLYVYSEEDPGLKEAEEGAEYLLSVLDKKIYFYMGEAPGYKLSAVYGEPMSWAAGNGCISRIGMACWTEAVRFMCAGKSGSTRWNMRRRARRPLQTIDSILWRREKM